MTMSQSEFRRKCTETYVRNFARQEDTFKKNFWNVLLEERVRPYYGMNRERSRSPVHYTL